jgi:type I restriction enzyme S subunit
MSEDNSKVTIQNSSFDKPGFYLSEDGEWIPDGWIETSLGEVSPTKQYGYTESASNEEIGPKFLRITDIQDDFVDWDTVPYCPISESDLKKYSLEIGDLLIARTGNSTGAVTTIKDQVNAVFASYLIRFKPEEQKVSHEFLDFLTRSRIWTSFVNSVKKGSAQGGANANDFAAFPIKLPPLPEQKAIADVLGSLDNKIELLREQNETLEALAQTLFKRWFIDFNFPDKNGNPYKDSGGSMIASEFGEIPAGCEVSELADFGRIICGKTPSKKEKAFFGEQIPFIKIPDMHGNMYVQTTGEYLSEEGAKSQINKSIPEGSIVVSCIATVGLVSLTSSEAQTNQQINSIVPAEESSREYLFLMMKNLYDFLQNLGAGGSATLNINTTSFSEIKVLKPKDCTLSMFNKVASPVFQKVEANSHQIHTLTKLRDTVLPKLMKGEIRILQHDA